MSDFSKAPARPWFAQPGFNTLYNMSFGESGTTQAIAKFGNNGQITGEQAEHAINLTVEAVNSYDAMKARIAELEAEKKACDLMIEEMTRIVSAREQTVARLVFDRDKKEARIEQLELALAVLLDESYAPDASCSCHISPPCSDCVNHGGLRDAISDAKSVLKTGGA